MRVPRQISPPLRVVVFLSVKEIERLGPFDQLLLEGDYLLVEAVFLHAVRFFLKEEGEDDDLSRIP